MGNDYRHIISIRFTDSPVGRMYFMVLPGDFRETQVPADKLLDIITKIADQRSRQDKIDECCIMMWSDLKKAYFIKEVDLVEKYQRMGYDKEFIKEVIAILFNRKLIHYSEKGVIKISPKADINRAWYGARVKLPKGIEL